MKISGSGEWFEPCENCDAGAVEMVFSVTYMDMVPMCLFHANQAKDELTDMEVEEPETYSDSARGLVISSSRALVECRKHSAELTEYQVDRFPKRVQYNLPMPTHYLASDILTWLGY